MESKDSPEIPDRGEISDINVKRWVSTIVHWSLTFAQHVASLLSAAGSTVGDVQRSSNKTAGVNKLFLQQEHGIFFK